MGSRSRCLPKSQSYFMLPQNRNRTLIKVLMNFRISHFSGIVLEGSNLARRALLRTSTADPGVQLQAVRCSCRQGTRACHRRRRHRHLHQMTSTRKHQSCRVHHRRPCLLPLSQTSLCRRHRLNERKMPSHWRRSTSMPNKHLSNLSFIFMTSKKALLLQAQLLAGEIIQAKDIPTPATVRTCNPPAEAASTHSETWEKVFERALRALMKTDGCEPFNTPVDLKEYPSYTEYVTRPMDFGKILKQLKQGRYPNAAAVRAHVQLVWDNCRAFNEDDSWIVQQADKLAEQFERLVDEVIARATLARVELAPTASEAGKHFRSLKLSKSGDHPKRQHRSAS
eukprot:TRINITY_DN2485_c0_g1_i4.p1 TRINITY_DN2485_c0_g1~~TRINITY_DN2485_c0_g1_i4.p1  ORF type:complete len:338 (-),score=19.08 TRINITY_DN2485_c0_g1_i4:717-1730(-)